MRAAALIYAKVQQTFLGPFETRAFSENSRLPSPVIRLAFFASNGGVIRLTATVDADARNFWRAISGIPGHHLTASANACISPCVAMLFALILWLSCLDFVNSQEAMQDNFLARKLPLNSATSMVVWTTLLIRLNHTNAAYFNPN